MIESVSGGLQFHRAKSGFTEKVIIWAKAWSPWEKMPCEYMVERSASAKPWGRSISSMSSVFKEQHSGHCSWKGVSQKKTGVRGWPAYVVGATKASAGTSARRDGTLLWVFSRWVTWSDLHFKSTLVPIFRDAGKDWRQEEKETTGWDGWMASPTQWRWVWTSSRRWWSTGEPGVLQSMGSQRVGHNWVTEQW